MLAEPPPTVYQKSVGADPFFTYFSSNLPACMRHVRCGVLVDWKFSIPLRSDAFSGTAAVQ